MGTWLQYLRGCQKPEGFARHNHNLRELEMHAAWRVGEAHTCLLGRPISVTPFVRVLVGLSVGSVYLYQRTEKTAMM
jgi:hypothetical protein